MRFFRFLFRWGGSDAPAPSPSVAVSRPFNVPSQQRAFTPPYVSRSYSVPDLQRSFVPEEVRVLKAQMHPLSTEDFTLNLATLADVDTVSSFAWSDTASATLADQGAALPLVTTRVSVPAIGVYKLVGLVTLASGQTKVVKLTLRVSRLAIDAQKDADAAEDFELTWPQASVIAASEWQGSGAGDPQDFDSHTATARISGGSVRQTMTATNLVTLASGEVVAVDIALKIT